MHFFLAKCKLHCMIAAYLEKKGKHKTLVNQDRFKNKKKVMPINKKSHKKIEAYIFSRKNILICFSFFFP
jgi:hypothetical protein